MKQLLTKTSLSVISCLLFVASLIQAQPVVTVNGNIINNGGNSTIPYTGTGGCTVVPQSNANGGGAPGAAWTGGTVFTLTLPRPLGDGTCGSYVLSSVNVNFNHTFDSDLDFYLRNRTTAQVIELSTDNGAGNDNYTNTKFCDNLGCPLITAGTAPFSGTFRPEGLINSTQCANDPNGNISTLAAMTIQPGDVLELIFYDDVGGDVGPMLGWSVVLAAAPTLPNIPAPITVSMAPGTCTPSAVACLGIGSCASSIRYSTTLVDATTVCNPLTIGNDCTAPGIVFPAAGVYNIYWIVANDCLFAVGGPQQITVLDTELPTFMPECPKGNRVNLNAGPGECEVSWDAPNFMAMDNCPGNSFFGASTRAVGCTLNANNGLGGTAGFSVGLLFNVVNTSGRSMALTALHFMPWTASGNMYRIYMTNAPGSYIPVTNNASAWTQIAGDSAKVGQPVFPPGNPRLLEKFGIGTQNIVSRINCQGQTIFDTTVVSNAIIGPGETRGIAIYSPNGGSFFYVNPAAPCSNTIQGDPNLGIDVRASRCQFGAANTPFNVLGTFSVRMFNGDIEYLFANSVIPVVQTCGAPYGPGCFFPIGCTRLCYRATDAAGNVATCEFDVCVNAYANPTRALVCNDEIQISLDQNCSATIGADMVLEGGPYACYDNYIVEARYWTGGGLIDRNPNLAGVQINGTDIGKELKLTVRDPVTGNSCWGHATVEDKIAPVLTCPAPRTFSCAINPIPANTGIPSVVENCGGASLSYRDNSTQGNCALGYSRRILRTWTAIDGSGNRGTCVQTITIGLGDLFEVTVPPNYDNLDQPMLACDAKIDRNKNVTPHMADFPECVDGYILDSAFWLANPNQPDQYPNRRLPRVLGWNCIDDVNSPWFGHPNPDPVYYPSHRQWSQTNPLCWGPDRHIMWIGTGKPGGAECFNLSVTYKDVVFNLATPGCDAGPVGCYKVLRQWTVMDWCTSVLGGHNQIIKVTDTEGPQVLYPDSARVNMESYACVGRWEVPPAWIIDNCSNEVHYTVEVEQGVVLGDETSGYVVVNMPEGIQIGYINAIDCCGNITKKRVVLNVVDRVPPQAICRSITTVSINGNQTPGSNFAKVCAESFDEGSFDNCQPHIYFKVIRMAELLGTNNGSNSNNVVACSGVNGDDNSILAGNQVYFDDCTYFCCADVGTKVMVVLRVFDVDPGAGPVTPIRMTSTSSVLNGRFSDCMIEVEVQNKSVPTVVAPPNIVVSCWFWFDITKLTDPNDATFGRVVTDLGDRKKVVTKDLVCYKFCERNDYTGYPGYVQTNAVPKPAPNQACEYYYQYFDTAHWDRKYELVWGFDGYVLSGCGNAPTITVNDLRECGQGVIQRIVSTQGPNNINVTAIQTIWFVDCDPFYVDDVTCNDPRYTDLMWPNGVCTQTPVTIDGCGADISPDNPQLGRPQVINNADDNCAL
ncbi:MAG: HYR domain-containing protein, partial [Saprospiraceae bacterium]|nr:HYR domain-containing protein [Saprospiraceae bacterium]